MSNKKKVKLDLIHSKISEYNSFLNSRFSYAVLLFTMLITVVEIIQSVNEIIREGTLIVSITKMVIMTILAGAVIWMMLRINKTSNEVFNSIGLLQSEAEKIGFEKNK